MAINVRGSFLMAKHAVPHMIARKYGKIINIGSGTAYKRHAGMLHYVASKGRDRDVDPHAVARAWRARHLRQHAGAGLHHERHAGGKPRPLDDAASRRARCAAAPSSATNYPQDLLGALIFLPSADSDFVTGQTIAVDGGSMNT